MFKSITGLLFALAGLFAGWLLFNSLQSAGAAGELDLALAKPEQVLLSGQKSTAPITLEREGYSWRMLPRADYQIAARVLQRTQYDDWQAAFSPVDLALGWGEISKTRVDRWIEWRQDDRWYYYRLRKRGLWGSPFSTEYVREHSANVHVIPATGQVASALQALEPDTLVVMEGKLVDVEATKDGAVQHFTTSLSRTDRGDASCEIMYVERLVLDGIEYR